MAQIDQNHPDYNIKDHLSEIDVFTNTLASKIKKLRETTDEKIYSMDTFLDSNMKTSQYNSEALKDVHEKIDRIYTEHSEHSEQLDKHDRAINSINVVLAKKILNPGQHGGRKKRKRTRKKRGGHHLYRTLRVSKYASQKQIRKAYNKLKKKKKLTKNVKYAYKILSKKKTRKQYNDRYKKRR